MRREFIMNVLKEMSIAPFKLPIFVCFRPLALGVLGIWSLFLIDSVNAQNLINTGAINNTGLIREENQAIGLPPSVDGRFEYFGSDQSVPACQYHDLLLTGSGTKTSAGGNFTVTDSIIIATNVTLLVGTGSVLTLNGSLQEGGYLAGRIQKSVDLSGSTSSSNFGNIGASIFWTGTALGLTTVLRGSDSALTGNGNQSIKRFYNLVPTTNSGLNATLVFKYSDNELSGQNPATLLLWRSVDSGATWRRQGGTTVDVNARTITKVGVTTFALYTAADTVHPLWPPIIEGVATAIHLTSGNNQNGTVGSALANPFVVTVTDTFGTPVPGANVMFAIASTPVGATGQSLSVTNATTGSNGQASTILTLGDRVGVYTVTAGSVGLSGSPVTFVATAAPGTARRIALTSGNNQIGVVGRPLTNQFVVTVSDTFGNPLQGTTVIFAIDSVPPGATGQSLSVSNATTDSVGHASTVLTLGTRVGIYSVTASSAGLTGSPIIFTAIGITATARTIALTSGNNQSDTVSQ